MGDTHLAPAVVVGGDGRLDLEEGLGEVALVGGEAPARQAGLGPTSEGVHGVGQAGRPDNLLLALQASFWWLNLEDSDTFSNCHT